MLSRLLEILRCPSCDESLSASLSAESAAEDLQQFAGRVLTCRCSRYPVVAGIPVIQSTAATHEALELIEAGEQERALWTMLRLQEDKRDEFRERLVSRQPLTFREGLRWLCQDSEADYFLYRFSDPTYLASEAILGALGSESRRLNKPLLDLCGGTGHLTRALGQIFPEIPVVLVDEDFWKLWLAHRLLARSCMPICCDAECALPFRSEAFSLIVCADAFHYVESKELLVTEIERVQESQGLAALLHLHNALRENWSAGTPLSPSSYQSLFRKSHPRLFRESFLLDAVLSGGPIDLSSNLADGDFDDEATLYLFASGSTEWFREYPLATSLPPPSGLRINPLYDVAAKNGMLDLTLRFPSDEYAIEFAACRRYLPERFALDAGILEEPAGTRTKEVRHDLLRRQILLDLPEYYT